MLSTIGRPLAILAEIFVYLLPILVVMVCPWHNWLLSCRRMRIDPYLSPCTKVKSKWIKELHIKPETLKLIEEKVGKSLEDMGTGEKFLNRTAMAVIIRLKIDKWDLKNCKTSVRQGALSLEQIGEKVFINAKSDKGLIFNIYKELKKLDSRKSDNTILKNGDGSKQRILN